MWKAESEIHDSQSDGYESKRWVRANDMPCKPCELCHELTPGNGGGSCSGAFAWFWMRFSDANRRINGDDVDYVNFDQISLGYQFVMWLSGDNNICSTSFSRK